MKERKYGRLLEDADVRRWYENVARGSRVTADVYLRRLGSFCEEIGKGPKEFVGLDDREIKNVLMDLVGRMEAEGFAGSYIETVVKAVRSWLSFNEKDIKVKLKIKGARDTPSLKDERVPTKDELKKIFLSGDKKARAACVLVAHSGLRIEVLGNYFGNDGLRVRDLPEMEVKDGRVEFRKVPTMVIVRKELSKARHQYFTFLSEEGCEYLKDYLESRIREGEILGPDSPIITPKQRMKPFIRAVNIGDIIREAIRKAGYPWRPYVLRSYFDTQLMLAESKGLVLRDYRTFWMGHKGDIEARYTTNKQRLPEEVIEDMREAYRRSQDFLQTYSKATSISEEEKKEMVLSALREVAKSYGLDPLKVRIELAQENPDFTVEDEIQAIQESIRKLFGKNGLARQDPPAQKVIRAEELNDYLAQGWTYLSELRDGRIIVRKEV